MGMFILGILFGWLIEWLFYTFYWKPAHSGDASAGGTQPERPVGSSRASEPVGLSATATATETPAPAAAAKRSPASSSKPASRSAAKKTANMSGSPEKDLQKISGIGPKISTLLVKAEISSYQSLADASPERLRDILAAAGTRYAMIDPGSWPKQAEYLDKGDSDGLARYLASLKQ